MVERSLEPDVRLGRQARDTHREPGGRPHADRHRLAVEQPPVAEARLDRVAERVAEVERGAGPARPLALVGEHDAHLGADRALDGAGERPRLARCERVEACLEPVPELAIDREPGLHDFRQAAPPLAR